ncbi:B12-binding domain-containing radical SAM protein [Streptomyces sp. NPDC060027]|uniref:B12-binding domain-containing radical SAM protein n=1 Tax=Streptomyces sp. NPDC060027 TaxID=3347040 RepID=UPI0036AEE6E8
MDANVEAFHATLREDFSTEVVRSVNRRLESLLGQDALSEDERRELRAFLGASVVNPDQVRAAVRVLQDEREFYHYPSYRQAVEHIVGWMKAISTLGFPGQFAHGFTLSSDAGFNLSSIADLTDPAILEKICRPFGTYLDYELPSRCLDGEYEVIGINVTYTQQLPFALYAARKIRESCPDAWIICGGTEVSDAWKYMDDRDRFFEVFSPFDICVIGEGESAFTEILKARGNGILPAATANVMIHPNLGGRGRALPVLHYEDIKNLTTPSYEKLPWHLYLAPHRFVYYTPSRGCYWNKCTFCDYGLNGDSPTSPWRQDPVGKTLDDLERISKFSQYVYFSVDVLAPATLLKIAQGIVDRGIDVRWSAEIRLEKYWSPERADLLKRSGCVAVSVGFESGNDRVLKLIDKGTTTQQTLQTVQNMRAAGLGVQMMAFTGFPGETLEEAFDTTDFLRRNRHLWTIGGVGTFGLTPGSIVAKEPDRFGIKNLRPRAGDDIHRELDYDDPAGHGNEQPELAKARQTLNVSPPWRPWVGGTDTPHALFYHGRFGPSMIEEISEEDYSEKLGEWPGTWSVNGRMVSAPGGSTFSFVRNDGVLVRVSKLSARILSTLGKRSVSLADLESSYGYSRQDLEPLIRLRLITPDTVPSRVPATAPRATLHKAPSKLGHE